MTLKKRILYEGYWIFQALCDFTGSIPSHTVRNFLYKYLFRITFPRDSIIYRGSRFWFSWNISIGHHTVLGDHLFLDGRRGIIIGNNVNIASESRFFTLEHDPESPDFGTKGGSIIIDDYVYVGSRVIVLPNVHVGEGAVLASGAVVTKDVAKWVMVGGVPARLICGRTRTKYEIPTKRRAIFQ